MRDISVIDDDFHAGLDAILATAVGDAVRRASENMRDARQSLAGSRPGGASEAQGEAMASLEEAAEQLSPQRSRRPPRRWAFSPLVWNGNTNPAGGPAKGPATPPRERPPWSPRSGTNLRRRPQGRAAAASSIDRKQSQSGSIRN